MGRTTNGSFVGQNSGNTSNNNQQWQQLSFGTYIKFKNRVTGLYIDGLGSTTNDANLGQWKKSNSFNQQWAITSLTNSPTPIGVVSAEELELQLLLNPNPFTSSFDLEVPNPTDIKSITIFDVSGRRVQIIEHSAVSNLMSLGASLIPGLYLVKVNGINWSQTFKVVKQ